MLAPDRVLHHLRKSATEEVLETICVCQAPCHRRTVPVRCEHSNGVRPPFEESGVLGDEVVRTLRRAPRGWAIGKGGAGEACGFPRGRESESVLVPRKAIHHLEGESEQEREDDAVDISQRKSSLTWETYGIPSSWEPR